MTFQSYIWLSDWGTKFQPSVQSSLLSQCNAPSLLRCSSSCNLNRECRTFDYDSSSLLCRLFDDTINTSNITSSVQTQRIGSVTIPTSFSNNYGQPCSKCVEDRYLACSDFGTCECPIEPVFDIFWPFNGNTHDSKNKYTSVSSAGISYNTSYWGIGLAIHLVRASAQYVKIPSGQILFYSSSFTIETWICPIGFTTADYAVFGQCQVNMTNKCMYFLVRNYKLTCGFGANATSGATSLSMHVWSHVACVYSFETQTLQVYLNGILDGSRSLYSFQGSSGDTTIGVTYAIPPGSNYFNGYLALMQFVSSAKNASDILRDATLMAYYSFDTSLTTDNSLNGINTTAYGSPRLVPGRVNKAIQVNPSVFVYTGYSSFPPLGVSNQPHTYSLWVKPTSSYALSTILFVTTPTYWCLSIIMMTPSCHIVLSSYDGGLVSVLGPIIPLNTWTHVGATYSPSNGFRLYINGIFYSTSGAFNYTAAGTSLDVFIGSDGGYGMYCATGSSSGFTGSIDELFVYSRELTASEILAAANP
ncbi:unnamed protein product [Rotaria socialis]|uniref:Apple domain-containing protein n=1 Tax=Rotaria socialis TaxID=392032 RepID=A0A820MQ67_9BILA|nr:unnamed protein product [Rotaria socialis]